MNLTVPAACSCTHVAALGRLGDEAYAFVDWLARRGQSWWQMLPLGPPDRYGSPYKAASAFAAWPGLLGGPRRRSKADELDASASANAYWIEDWGATPARRGRRPGALRPRVGARCARYARDARRAADRRRPDLRRARQRRPPGAPRALPGRARSPACRRTRSPTRASCGATRSTTGRRCSAAATAGGSSACAARSSSSTSPASTISAASSPTGRSRPARATRSRGHWQRGPGRAVFDAATSELGELPLIAEDLGVITPAGRAAARGLGLPGMVVLQFDFDPRSAQPAPPRQPRASTGRLHGDARPRHAARLVGLAAAGRRARGRRADHGDPRPPRPRWRADRAGLRLPRARWPWSRSRTCSGSAPRAG